MKLDFTQEVILEKKNYKIYKILQSILYAGSFIFGCYLIFLLLFPSGYFTFSFVNFHSNKNTLKDPRNIEGILLEKGEIQENKEMFFNASLAGKYSKAKFTLDLNKKSDKIENAKVEIKKSYRAFFLPEGKPIGFQEGALIKEKDNFYIISEGKARKFESKNILFLMGFSEASFANVSQSDLIYNPAGDPINNSNEYPNGAVFKIGDNFYLLADSKLKKFISSSAYLSRFNENQAVLKDNKIFEKYEVSEEMASFAQGSLFAYGGSAYVVSKNEILPIGDPTIFEASGFSWGDIINVSGDEMSFYLKGKIFALDSIHPDGSIFYSNDDGKYYIILNSQKHLLASEKAASSWNKRMAIKASEKSLSTFDECHLKEKTFNLGTDSYSCEVMIENLSDLIGKDYELRLASENDIKLDKMNLKFIKTVSRESFRQSIFNLIGKIKGNYVKQ